MKFSEAKSKVEEYRERSRKVNAAKLQIESAFGVKIEDGRHSIDHLNDEEYNLFQTAVNAMHNYEKHLNKEVESIEEGTITLKQAE